MGVPVGVDTISRLRYAMGSGFFFDSQFQGLADVVDYSSGNGILAGVTTAAQARTALGLGTIATQNAGAVALTGGAIDGAAIGGSTPSTGAFTTLAASGAVTGAGFTAYLASPPAIGATVAAAGTFSALSTGVNTLFGPTALGSVTSGTANVGIGSNALNALTSAVGYVAIGDHALESVVSLNTLGASVAVGRFAGQHDTGGTGNIYIGEQAGQANVTGNESIYIGRQCGLLMTSGSNTIGGLNSFTAVTTGGNNTGWGQDNGKYLGTTSHDNTLIGQSSGKTVTGANPMNYLTGVGSGTFLYAVGNGDMNSVAVGYLAMQGNSNGTSSTGGTQCVAIGGAVLANYTTATQVIAIGQGAAGNVTSGSQSVFIGTNSGNNITTGGDLIMIGTYRSNNAITGVTNNTSDAIAIGGNNKIGNNDLAIGVNALASSTENGNGSTAIGHDALHAVTTGDNNVGFGPGAGYVLTTGSNNLIVGNNVASATLTTGSGNIVIGVSNVVDTAASGSSNTFRMGGTGGVTFSATGLDTSVPAWQFKGTIALAGSSSGVVTLNPQAAAGTYNFNLPTTAGSANQALLSQGGGSSAMTWGTVGLVLSGTSGSIGGGALLAGARATATVSVTGATTSMAVAVTPAVDPGAGITWDGWVSSADTVTVEVIAVVAGTPTATTYNVRVIQ